MNQRESITIQIFTSRSRSRQRYKEKYYNNIDLTPPSNHTIKERKKVTTSSKLPAHFTNAMNDDTGPIL